LILLSSGSARVIPFGHPGVKSYGEHEIPLFSAIQDPPQRDAPRTGRLGGNGARGPSEDQIKERVTGLVARQFQFFAHRCKHTDLTFMIDLLEQWETLTDNEEFWQKTEHPLAAAEIHLAAMKRREKERAA
jgi:hypothetical protein